MILPFARFVTKVSPNQRALSILPLEPGERLSAQETEDKLNAIVSLNYGQQGTVTDNQHLFTVNVKCFQFVRQGGEEGTPGQDLGVPHPPSPWLQA